MLKLIDNLLLLLSTGITPTDTAVSISSIDAAKVNALPIGGFTYLTFNDGTRMETVKYTHNAVIVVTPGTMSIMVDRGQLGTTAKSWPIKSCLKTQLTVAVTEALICQKITGGC
jgi:hypothetical protein